MMILLILLGGVYKGETMEYNFEGSLTLQQEIDTGIDIIHGGILTIATPDGVYLYHGEFEGSIWSDATIYHKAKFYKRPISDITSSTYVEFANDLHHQCIVDLLYSDITKKIYVLFMGNSYISIVDPITMVAEDFVGEALPSGPTKYNQMGKLAMNEHSIYHICQTYPSTTVIRYDLVTGEKKASRTLQVPAGHGGIFFNNILYVTTSQNDDLGSMLYALDEYTLRIRKCTRLPLCMVATHEMAGMYNPINNEPYLFIGDENEDQSLTTVANVTMVNANRLYGATLMTTNTSIQGGIWGVKAHNGKIIVSRGSDPGTIEILDPWNETSTFFTLPSGNPGMNGSPEMIGNSVYLKVFRRFHMPGYTSKLLHVDLF